MATIDIRKLSISNDRYEDFQRKPVHGGKYQELFLQLKQGQRINVPIPPASKDGAPNHNWCSAVASALEKFVQRNHGCNHPLIRTVQNCGDGFGGVWWLGERSAPSKTKSPKADKPESAPIRNDVFGVLQKRGK